MKRTRQRRWEYPVLILAAFLYHGLLLLSDGRYVDGWLYWAYIREGRWELLFNLSAQQGVPQTAWLYRALALFPDLTLAHKLIAFSCLLLSALLIYQLADESGLLSRYESLFLALFTLGFPAYQFALDISHIWNLLPYTIFLAGWLFVLRAEKCQTQSRKRWRARHLLALLALLFSFMNAALLPYHLGFLLLFVEGYGRRRRLTHVQALQQVLRRRTLLVLLPLIYWLPMRAFFPPHGVFVDYNELALANLWAGETWVQFADAGILHQLTKSLGLIPLGLLAMLGIAVLLLERRADLKRIRFFGNDVSTTKVAFFGAILLLLAILPFVMVRKGPTLHGFDTRITLLLALPVALLLLAGLRLLFAVGERELHRTGILFLATLFFSFWLAQTNNYLAWQARWVKDRSILLNLEAHPELADCSLVYVDDQYLFPQWRRSVPHEASTFLNRRYFQEWIVILREVYGPEAGLVGIDSFYQEPPYFYQQWVNQLKARSETAGTDLFFLQHYDPCGCALELTIEDTDFSAPLSFVGVVRRYFQYRFLEPEKMTPFLQDLTTLSVKPLALPPLPACHA